MFQAHRRHFLSFVGLEVAWRGGGINVICGYSLIGKLRRLQNEAGHVCELEETGSVCSRGLCEWLSQGDLSGPEQS